MGWARANLLYDRAGPYPKIGSIQEAVLLAVREARVAGEISQTRAIVQATVGARSEKAGEAISRAFEDYKKVINAPAQEAAKRAMSKALEEVAQAAPMLVTSLDSPKQQHLSRVSPEDL